VPTQSQRSAATTKALRKAAQHLFARHGFERVAVDDIAASAGVTRGAFYHHYDSKEALFEVVFHQVETMLVDAVRAAAVTASDPRDQLRLGMNRYLELASDRRHSRIVLIDAPAVLGHARYQQAEETHFLGLVTGSIAAIRPTARATEHALTARALLAAVCELATQTAEHHADLDTARAVIQAFINGALPAEPPPS
jgi:AcrR family transcriptional regulator